MDKFLMTSGFLRQNILIKKFSKNLKKKEV